MHTAHSTKHSTKHKVTIESLSRFLAFVILFLMNTYKANAQNAALYSINAQLRQMFSPLSKPLQPKRFLYDMAVHSTDSSFYVTNCADTNDTDLWYKVYDEMYHSAYDTSTLQRIENIYNSSNNFSDDTIPIGIINYAYYGLKLDALSTNTYFNFDTINNIYLIKVQDQAGLIQIIILFLWQLL